MHQNSRGRKIIHGMRPLGCKDRSINLSMCICRNVPFVFVLVLGWEHTWLFTRWVPGLTITICNKITGRLWHGSEGFFEWRKLDTVELLILRWRAVWLSALRGRQDLLNLNRVQVYNNGHITFLSLWHASTCMQLCMFDPFHSWKFRRKTPFVPKSTPFLVTIFQKNKTA